MRTAKSTRADTTARTSDKECKRDSASYPTASLKSNSDTAANTARPTPLPKSANDHPGRGLMARNTDTTVAKSVSPYENDEACARPRAVCSACASDLASAVGMSRNVRSYVSLATVSARRQRGGDPGHDN